MGSILEAWQALGSLQGNAIAGAITIGVPLAAYFLRPSVRLRWGRANVGHHTLKNNSGSLNLSVEKHYLQNTGRKPASNIEFVFNYQPSELSVWQPRNYSCSTTPEGHYVVSIPQIAPKELVIIDSIYVDVPPALIVSVKCADCLGKEVEFRVNRFFGNALALTLGGLALLGCFYLVRLIVLYFM